MHFFIIICIWDIHAVHGCSFLSNYNAATVDAMASKNTRYHNIENLTNTLNITRNNAKHLVMLETILKLYFTHNLKASAKLIANIPNNLLHNRSFQQLHKMVCLAAHVLTRTMVIN